MPIIGHRALTHNSWFLSVILERIFGTYITNSDGKQVSVRDIGEDHVLEDFRMKFIPTAQDYLQEIPFKPWMQNAIAGVPPSNQKLNETTKIISEKDMVFDGSNNLYSKVD